MRKKFKKINNKSLNAVVIIAVVIFSLIIIYNNTIYETDRGITGESITTNGLKIYYKFEEDTRDLSGNLYQGYVKNEEGYSAPNYGIEFIDGISGKAAVFDGSDYIEPGGIQNRPNFLYSDLTYSAWIKTDKEQTTNIIGGYDTNNNYILLRLIPKNRIRFTIKDNNGAIVICDTNYNTDYDNDEWHHIAVVRDFNNLLYIYFDGAQVKSCADSVGAIGTTHNMMVAGPWDYFEGEIDELRIYDRALNENEIQTIYNEETLDKIGLLAYYKFDRTISGILDYSMNSNGGVRKEGAYRTEDAVSGRAIGFDGVNDYIEFDNIIPSPNEGTIMVWVKPETKHIGNIIYIGQDSGDGFGDEQELHLSVLENGEFSIYFGSKTTNNNHYRIDAGNYIPGNWYHLVGMYKNNGFVKLFINGQEVGSDSVNKDIQTFKWIAPTLMGKPRANKRYFKGIIDEVRVYDYLLSNAEIQEIYEEEKPIEELPRHRITNIGTSSCSVGGDEQGRCMCSGNNCLALQSDESDTADCSGDLDCIYNGNCYEYESMISVQGEKMVCDRRIWNDCDFDKGFLCGETPNWEHCNNCKWLVNGEDEIIGEYNSATATECCGDDVGENIVVGVDGTLACCSNSDDVVIDRKCMAKEEYQELINLPKNFNPDIGYFDKLRNKIVLWKGNSYYETSNNLDYTKVNSGDVSGLSDDFSPDAGYYHGVNNGRIILWQGDKMYYSTNGISFGGPDTMDRGLGSGFKPSISYYDKFNDSVIIWKGNQAYRWQKGDPKYYPITFNGLPSDFSPTVGYYHEKGSIVIVLWDGNQAYRSVDGGDFEGPYEIGTGTREDLPSDFEPDIGYYQDLGEGAIVLWSGSEKYIFSSDDEIFDLTTDEEDECVENGGICRIGECESGERGRSYDCDFDNEICCVENGGGGGNNGYDYVFNSSRTCRWNHGEICKVNEECDVLVVNVSDTNECCLGSCLLINIPENACENAGGACRFVCHSDEDRVSLDCIGWGDICCMEKEEENACEKKGGYCSDWGCDEEAGEVEAKYECGHYDEVCCIKKNEFPRWLIWTIIGILAIAIIIVIIFIILGKNKKGGGGPRIISRKPPYMRGSPNIPGSHLLPKSLGPILRQNVSR